MNVLAVGAHPDDLEFLCAGTLAKYVRLGHHVAMAVATNGEVGSSKHTKEEIAAIRKAEAAASAAVIGADFYWMGFPDEFLFNDKPTRLAFIDLVRQAKPDLIICHDPQNDYHPDHTTSGQIIWDIHVMASVPNIVTVHPPTHKIPEIIYMDTIGGVNFIPNRYVSITADIEAKRAMLACHKSQEQWLHDIYGVPAIALMETFSKMRGFQCGHPFGEGFRVPPLWPRTIDAEGLL